MRGLYFFLILFLSVSAASKNFPADGHCVAWETKKRMFLVKKVYPVGVNCSIQTAMREAAKGQWQLEGRFPIKKFESGEKDRDAEVFVILQGEKQADLIFKTQQLTAVQWKALLNGESAKFLGELIIGGKSFAVEVPASISGEGDARQVKGVLETKFSKLGIKPPKVAGGAIAKVKDLLKLHFQLQLKHVKGLEALLK